MGPLGPKQEHACGPERQGPLPAPFCTLIPEAECCWQAKCCLATIFHFKRVLVPEKGKSSKPTASDSGATGFAITTSLALPPPATLVISAFSQPQLSGPSLGWHGLVCLSVRITPSCLPRRGFCVGTGWQARGYRMAGRVSTGEHLVRPCGPLASA